MSPLKRGMSALADRGIHTTAAKSPERTDPYEFYGTRKKTLLRPCLQAVLEAGRLAPTGKNHQPQRILVVQSPEGLAKMAQAMHNTNAYTAKAVLMICSDTTDCWVRSFDSHCIHEIDASIVTTYMMLAATEQGL